MTNFSLSALSLLSSVLFATACGAVNDPQDEGADPADVVGDFQNNGVDLGSGAGSDTPAPVAPIVLAPPTRTSGAHSLAGLAIADHDGIVNLINDTSPFTVTEQRFVTQTDEVIQLELDLLAPTGTYGRTIGSDTVRATYPTAEKVLCEQGSVATFDPKCESVVPQPSGLPVTGTLASGHWRMDIQDETGASMSCTTVGNKEACTLPARKGAAYRIITAVGQVTDLWDGTGIGIWTDLGRSYAGNHRAMEYQCYEWSYASGGRVYCELRNDYTRFVGLDRAFLTIDPLTVEVTANGVVDAIPSAAIQWDSGNDDLPGSNY